MSAARNTAAPANAALKDEPLLTENASKVLQARYLKKDEAGACTETPRDLFRRVAESVAAVETTYGGNASQRQHWEDRFYRIMADGHFMPNSPTLMNAGREMGMLSACFVLPVRDSVSDIFDSIKYTALIQKAGGGTGFAFDELRPTGDYIASSGGTTSGPITFWRAFSEATNAIQQGAFRRGANMGMMYIHHPDILKFLHAKQDLSQFTNYNISVKVTDAWMDQYRADADTPHLVRNPRNGKVFALPRDLKIWEYDIRSLIEIDPAYVVPVSVEKRESYFCSPKLLKPLPAEIADRVYTKRMIWDIIVQNAWHTGEPGVVFIDRINEHNPTPHVGRIEATNPCGEQPLLPFEACNLGSVNLGPFVRNECTPQAVVDWDALRDAVWVSTRFLDNVIDANNYPLEQIDHICKANRKIGIGIMGFADALYRLNVAYNSDDGIAWGEKFMKFVNDEAHNCSEQLANERGNFPNWEGSIWQTRHNRPMRNAAVTTVAPTGTISIIANCSGGVEPMFSLAFIRNVLRGQKEGARPLVEVNDTFRMVAAKRGFLSDDLLERIAHEGTLAHIDEIPEDIRRVFVCAHDITPEWHMRMQAGFQRHCDSSISKTINFPNAASREDVEKIYNLAYDLRCKGVTVYRDGCRSFQPMALKKKSDEAMKGSAGILPAHAPGSAGILPAQTGAHAAGSAGILPAQTGAHAAGSAGILPAAAPTIVEKIVEKIVVKEVIREVPRQRIEPMDLPEIVSSIRIRQLTPFGNLHCTISVDPRTGRELEIFAHLGKGGDVATSDLEGMGRIGSLWLRSGGSLTHLIKQWQGIGSSLQIPTKTGRITSLPDGLAAALQRYMKAKERFGLSRLLLGEIDLAELDRPNEGSAGILPAHSLGSAGILPAGLSGSAGILPASVGTGVSPVSSPNGNGGNGGHPVSPSVPPAIAQRLSNDALTGAPQNRAAQNGASTNGASHNGTAQNGATHQNGAAHKRAADGISNIAANSHAMSGHAGNGRGDSSASNGNGLVASAVAELDTLESPADEALAHSASDLSTIDPSVAASLRRPVAPSAEHALADSGIFELVETEITSHTDTLISQRSGEIVEHVSTTTMSTSTSTSSSAQSHCSLVHQHDAASHFKLKCPECQTTVARQEGCLKCLSCGWAQC